MSSLVHILALCVAEDGYHGDAQFTVQVDAFSTKSFTAKASHAAGAANAFVLLGDWDVSVAHQVHVTFLNDLYAGTPQTDRNLYVTGMAYDNVDLAVPVTPLLSTGSTFVGTIPATAPAPTATTPTAPAPIAPAPTAPTATATPAPAPVSSLTRMALLGVNIAGGEFGSVPGVMGTDYVYPTHAQIDYQAACGCTVIRLTHLVERVWPGGAGPLDAPTVALWHDLIAYAAGKGLSVDLDAHDYGYLFGAELEPGAAAAKFAGYWQLIAAEFAGSANVIFGLMNEPHDQAAADWMGVAQAGLAAIRAAGAKQLVLVPGTGYTGAWTWFSSGNAAAFLATISDPANNVAVEVHQYLNPSGSGSDFAPVTDPQLGVERLTAVTNWAAANNVRLWLGEFNTPPDAVSLVALTNMLTYMQANRAVWLGGALWAAGAWWPSNYPQNVEPQAGVDAPQMVVLREFLQ